jgi:hypothetical protein
MLQDSCKPAVAIGSLESDMEFLADDGGAETDVIRFKPGRMPPVPEHNQIEESGTPGVGDDPDPTGKPRSETAAVKKCGA